MAFTPAAKVGITTVAAVIALGAGLSWLTSMSFGPKGYDVHVVYTDVAGLMNGAGVMLMGVRVGRVEAITPQERQVEVHLKIFDANTKILDKSRFKIMSQGIIGEMSLEIFPPKVKRGEPSPPPDAPVTYILDEDRVRGDDPARMALVMEEMTETFEEFQKTVDPKKMQDLFAKTAENLYQSTETVKRLGNQAEGIMGGFKGTPMQVSTILDNVNRAAINTDRLITGANPNEINAMVADLRRLSKGLLGTYESYFGGRQAKANDQLVGTFRSLTQQLDRLATQLNNTAGDPTVQADVKDTIKNIRELTAGITRATAITEPNKALSGFRISPRVQGVAANTPAGTGLAGNLGLRLYLNNNYLQGGVEQIGEGNYFNLQFGADDAVGPLGYQFGLIRSKLGVGVDYNLSKNIALMGQLYDPFRPTARIGATYFGLGGSQYGLLAQGARTFATGENFLWLGVEWRPNN